MFYRSINNAQGMKKRVYLSEATQVFTPAHVFEPGCLFWFLGLDLGK